MKLAAPAKINLGLEILSKTIDGYHKVNMIMQSIGLYDFVDIISNNSGEISVKTNIDVGCEAQNNIAFKAANAFLEYANIKNVGVDIKIEKRIPFGAGMAGGSADAAAVIVGMNKLLKTNYSLNELLNIGAKVGCDVPFCIVGGAAQATGRGECLKSLSSMPECGIVVIKPDFHVSTAEAYANFDNLKVDVFNDLNLLENSMENQNLAGICKNLYNRFEQVIDEPQIINIKNDLVNNGASGALMTGSGSAIYGVFSCIEDAECCFNKLKSKYSQIYFTNPVNHGAHVLEN